jgi:hypothetical protein
MDTFFYFFIPPLPKGRGGYTVLPLDEECAYMFNMYKNQLCRQTGSRNLTDPKTLPTIWYTYMTLVTKYHRGRAPQRNQWIFGIAPALPQQRDIYEWTTCSHLARGTFVFSKMEPFFTDILECFRAHLPLLHLQLNFSWSSGLSTNSMGMATCRRPVDHRDIGHQHLHPHQHVYAYSHRPFPVPERYMRRKVTAESSSASRLLTIRRYPVAGVVLVSTIPKTH